MWYHVYEDHDSVKPYQNQRDFRQTMFNISKCNLPPQSLLRKRVSGSDFLDCYSVSAEATPRRAAVVITDFPGWAGFLLQIRRVVTAPFGLSQDGPDALDKVGPFPVESENDQELIAGFDDKHLDFRVSVLSIDSRIYLATWVHPHNFAGRVYLMTILPFHVLSARNGLARVRADSNLHRQRTRSR